MPDSTRTVDHRSPRPEKVLLAKPRGFCAGVERAIDVVEIALQLFPGPIYVRKEIVHNKHVVEELKAKGAIFVEELDEVPDGARVIFSAHGVSPEVREKASARQLKVIDATCPLVTKVHHEAVRYANEGRTIILVGHEGHDEVIGTMGEAPKHIRLVGSAEEAEQLSLPDPDKVAVITQTTLSVDDTKEVIDVFRRRFPLMRVPTGEDICYATQNRQTAVKQMAEQADLLLVIGSGNSSNSNRLKEVSESFGTTAYLIDDVNEIDPAWLTEKVKCVGITAGASAPEYLVQDVLKFFQDMGVTNVEEIDAVTEEVSFALPMELTTDHPAPAATTKSSRVG
ncbi:MAG TPA: 4-hydroxy-3-methylbut-2-enyl diphosphate reductase [Nitrospiria bacterium]|nr:4-hydroxy-3-methylbut-2-enyl diphosphate reductase [Nitrospiria bacterium]